MRTVCRACYGPAPSGIAPWQPFVCQLCYVVDPHSKRGKALARIAKEKARKEKKHGKQDER